MKEYTSFIKSSKIRKGPCVLKFDNLLKQNIFSSNIIVVKVRSIRTLLYKINLLFPLPLK